MEGKIKKLVQGKGFGFISSGGNDVFFHRSALQGTSFDTLEEGGRVKFDLEKGLRGPKAVNIRLIGDWAKEVTNGKGMG